MLVVYSLPIKAIIHEKLGDGIMSAIDFRASVESRSPAFRRRPLSTGRPIG
jgi:cyanate lyase